jgi:hypothetical protein
MLAATTAVAINTAAIVPILAIVAGIVILVAPRVLNYVVAFYLIIVGVLGLMAVWGK